MNSKTWGAVLLLVGGLVHLVPGLYVWLTTIGGSDWPWIQMVVGLASVLVALPMLSKNGGGSA